MISVFYNNRFLYKHGNFGTNYLIISTTKFPFFMENNTITPIYSY